MQNKLILLFCAFFFLAMSGVQAVPYRLDLSGGTGGSAGTSTYTAPNGTVVNSTAVVYSNGSYYYMGYLFNHTLASGNHTDYWLTSSTGNQTLTIALNQNYYMDYIRVYPVAYTNNASTDRKANYQVEISANGSTYTNITGGFVNTNNDLLGAFRDHNVDLTIRYVRFTLEQTGSYGVTLNEIELYVDNNPVPEPASMLLLGVGCLFLTHRLGSRKKQFFKGEVR